MSDPVNGAPTSLSDAGFSTEQKEYLSGWSAGVQALRSARGLPSWADILGPNGAGGTMPNALASSGSASEASVAHPDALMIEGAREQEASGARLVPEEKAKRQKHPLDRFDEIVAHAREGRFPKGTDVLMWKYHGLFYVAPTQDAFMCRLRFYGGLVSNSALEAMADLSECFGGGYADITTRANFQIREIAAERAAQFLEEMQAAGLVARGSGADNVRNVTGGATAGLDPRELCDTRALCRSMHLRILNSRELYDLPRKFNIAFDGGGAIPTLEETNDIGFTAIRLAENPGDPGQGRVVLRVAFGGITGHRDFARATGIAVAPEDAVDFAVAALRLFIRHGDRSDRKKARLKYLLEKWGHDEFLARTLELWGGQVIRLEGRVIEERSPLDKSAHIGWHRQKQHGLFYVGVAVAMGRLSSQQLRGVAAIAREFGSGEVRLTVWQNLLVPGIAEADRSTVEDRLEALDLPCQASGVRAGLVACTGAAGCKYANAHTKQHGQEIALHLEKSLSGFDPRLNIHLTGCPNSCAQHYIGDLGLLGTKVEAPPAPDGSEADDVEGYHFFVGGGFGDDPAIARELIRSVPAERAPRVIEALLRAFESTRGPEEEFAPWSARHSTDQLRELCEGALVA